jgi:hypothetical protein
MTNLFSLSSLFFFARLADAHIHILEEIQRNASTSEEKLDKQILGLTKTASISEELSWTDKS